MRARAKYSELVGVSRALLATTAPAERSGGPRHPRNLRKSISEGRGKNWSTPRALVFRARAFLQITREASQFFLSLETPPNGCALCVRWRQIFRGFVSPCSQPVTHEAVRCNAVLSP